MQNELSTYGEGIMPDHRLCGERKGDDHILEPEKRHIVNVKLRYVVVYFNAFA